MNILALDTAYQSSMIALQAGKVQTVVMLNEPREQAARLLPAINSLLSDAALDLKDLDYLGLTCGPGSFVGVRMGMSLVQGFAYVFNFPLLALSSLRLLAQAACRLYGYHEVWVCTNAYMAEVYIGHYRMDDNGVMQAVVPDALCRPETLSFSAKNQVVGNGVPLLTGVDSRGALISAKAEDLLRLCEADIAMGKRVRLADLRPNYLRGKAAWQENK